MNLVSLEQLSHALLSGLAGTSLRVWIDSEHSLELQLRTATPAKTVAANGLQYEQFTLVFAGPADRLLPQRIYLFEAPSIGQFEMFIVPVGLDQTGVQYEATFNRLVKSR